MSHATMPETFPVKTPTLALGQRSHQPLISSIVGSRLLYSSTSTIGTLPAFSLLHPWRGQSDDLCPGQQSGTTLHPRRRYSSAARNIGFSISETPVALLKTKEGSGCAVLTLSTTGGSIAYAPNGERPDAKQAQTARRDARQVAPGSLFEPGVSAFPRPYPCMA